MRRYSLQHKGFKYISRYKVGGKWRYVYADANTHKGIKMHLNQANQLLKQGRHALNQPYSAMKSAGEKNMKTGYAHTQSAMDIINRSKSFSTPDFKNDIKNALHNTQERLRGVAQKQTKKAKDKQKLKTAIKLTQHLRDTEAAYNKAKQGRDPVYNSQRQAEAIIKNAAKQARLDEKKKQEMARENAIMEYNHLESKRKKNAALQNYQMETDHLESKRKKKMAEENKAMYEEYTKTKRINQKRKKANAYKYGR